jgi:hypothetical protein
LLWFAFAVVTSILLLFILGRGLYGNLEQSNSTAFRGLAALVTGVIADVPFAGNLWAVTPVFREGGLLVFFLSPVVWITAILGWIARRHLDIATRMRHEHPYGTSYTGGNHIGNIHASGNVHIHQAVGEKPTERPSGGVVLVAVLSGLATIICELIKAWNGL